MLLYVIAGEPSGDLHGGQVLKTLKTLHPSLQSKGIGGPCLVEAGLQPLIPFEKLQVMGFSDVLKKLTSLYTTFHFVAKRILEEKPEGVLTIDYPGFNLRLAKYLRKKGYQGKLIHYIAPSVWAWKKERAREMADSYDLLLSILPFEKPWFAPYPLDTAYIGNPTAEQLKEEEEIDPPVNGNILALFPGSRAGEIKRHLPLFLQSAELYLKKHPEANIVISTDPCFHPLIQERLPLKKLQHFQVLSQKVRFGLMKKAKGALAKSGTVSLELALRGCPSVISYEMPFLNHFLARHVFKINLPFYALPNILLNKSLFPEHYGHHLSPEALFSSLEKVIESKNEIDKGREALLKVLGPLSPSHEGAQLIHRLLCK